MLSWDRPRPCARRAFLRCKKHETYLFVTARMLNAQVFASRVVRNAEGSCFHALHASNMIY